MQPASDVSLLYIQNGMINCTTNDEDKEGNNVRWAQCIGQMCQTNINQLPTLLTSILK